MSNDGGSYCRRTKEKEEEYRKARDRDAFQGETHGENPREIVCQRAKAPRSVTLVCSLYAPRKIANNASICRVYARPQHYKRYSYPRPRACAAVN